MEKKNSAGFHLDREAGYFSNRGVEVIAFEDFYPAGHQGGVSIIMHGERVAANGDVRFEPTPGQWQPIPRQVSRLVEQEASRISTRLHYPDEEGHLKGFNPMVYPDCTFDYTVSVTAEGDSVRVTVDTDALPSGQGEELFFNLELFPGLLFGRPWMMDDRQGIFPRHPSAPILQRPSRYANGLLAHEGIPDEVADSLMEKGKPYSPLRGEEEIAAPYAVGHRFTLCPEDPLLRLTVKSLGEELRLYDGRVSHNNGWFVLSSPLSFSGGHAAEWIITPHAEEGWISPPRVQVSQVGYLPAQPKIATVELDRRDGEEKTLILWRISPEGRVPVQQEKASDWGRFLRYRYIRFDFSSVTETGLYQVTCGDACSEIFRIAPDVFDRGVWQPVLEYFLPIQMCHMRVNEKYRVWHGRCHMDDARMAPVCRNHFDGYRQGPQTLTRYAPGDPIPGLNRGGWHDAGDFDLRIESQSGEAYLLSQVWEEFRPEWDSTAIDQRTQTVEIHHPDGRNDLLQQIEHGALAVLGGWQALGRLYRGIITGSLRRYVLLGDPVNMTDGISGNEDDRWVFTEDNPVRELNTAAHLAAVSRSLHTFNPDLSGQALEAARALFAIHRRETAQASRASRVHAAAELYLTTKEQVYADAFLAETELIISRPEKLGWIAARVVRQLNHAEFTHALKNSLRQWQKKEAELSALTPFGVPYKPHIWGAGWEIQRLGCEHYYLRQAFPDLFSPDLSCHALSFVLGCHPGRSVCFTSGVGAQSVTAAYGFNRAEFSHVPGGTVSGTALIRPDLPELKDWPYLWQQTEYVLGGGSTRFMFLVLAVREMLGQESEALRSDSSRASL